MSSPLRRRDRAAVRKRELENRQRQREARERKLKASLQEHEARTEPLPGGDACTYGVARAGQIGRIVLQFDRPVTWIGLDGTQALRLGQVLVRHAVTLDAKPMQDVTREVGDATEKH